MLDPNLSWCRPRALTSAARPLHEADHALTGLGCEYILPLCIFRSYQPSYTALSHVVTVYGKQGFEIVQSRQAAVGVRQGSALCLT